MRVILAFISICVFFTSAKSPHQKLLVVSYDGFRYDYLDLHRDVTPFLNKLKSSSSYARHVLNVFPTQTFPNHFSIATGVYAGVHGVLGSKVFDKESNNVLNYGYDLFHYNKDIIPIWVLNENAGGGRHSGVIMWTGSDFEYGKTNPTFEMKFDSKITYRDRVGKMIDWFTHPKTPANLIMMYFEEPDESSHAFGPDSPQVKTQLKNVDDITACIMVGLKNNNLTDVNVIFLSDHGMESVTANNIIDLRPVIGDVADMYGTSPVLQIYPKKEKNLAEVYNKLKKFSVEKKTFKAYLQAEIPEHFHIKNCKRAPPILAVAEPPYAFQDLYDGIEWYVKHKNASRTGTFGVHGYDPMTISMHPYLIAHGPLFKVNYDAGELRTVDMYSLFANILHVREPTAVKPNGTISAISKIFKSPAVPPRMTQPIPGIGKPQQPILVN